MKEDTRVAPPIMIMHKASCIVAGLALPLLLIPIVNVTGFSEIVEEVAKTLVIAIGILPILGFGPKVRWTLLFGLSFGISESIFYLSSTMETGSQAMFVERLVSTVPMHMVTALVIVIFGSRGKKYLPVGLIIAIAIHLAFNYFI